MKHNVNISLFLELKDMPPNVLTTLVVIDDTNKMKPKPDFIICSDLNCIQK